MCVRDRALYFGRSSRRKRVGEISSDNGSSFRCVRATILLCNMCVRYNIIYRLPSAPHAPRRQITTIWPCGCKMKFGCNVPRGNRKNRQTLRVTSVVHTTQTDIEYNTVTTTLR